MLFVDVIKFTDSHELKTKANKNLDFGLNLCKNILFKLT